MHQQYQHEYLAQNHFIKKLLFAQTGTRKFFYFRSRLEPVMQRESIADQLQFTNVRDQLFSLVRTKKINYINPRIRECYKFISKRTLRMRDLLRFIATTPR
jgi:hypothetical protein